MSTPETPSIDHEPTAPPRNDGDTPPVLVVDDSPLFRQMAEALIRDGVGCRTVHAADGIEALALLEPVEPSVVLTDLRMPRMDGLELVRAIRADHPHIPVIVMTAYGSEAVALRALNAGAASYIPKHCLASELVATLRRVLSIVEGSQRQRLLLACQTARAESFELGNDADLFPALIALIQEGLLSFSIGDDATRLQVAIAVQEALANALYHGNLGCSSDLRQVDDQRFYRLADERRDIEPYRSRRIHVETRIDREAFRIEIRDEGPGFDVSGFGKPVDPQGLVRVGGRGMILIRSFLDEVLHNETGNQVTLIKRSGPGGSSGSTPSPTVR